MVPILDSRNKTHKVNIQDFKCNQTENIEDKEMTLKVKKEKSNKKLRENKVKFLKIVYKFVKRVEKVSNTI